MRIPSFFEKKHEFSRVPTDENEEYIQRQHKERSSLPQAGSRGRKQLLIGIATLSAIAVLAFVAFRTTLFKSNPQRWTSCGDSKRTALERGCKFDLISFAWQTPECYDHSLVSEFASWEGDWTFYADSKFTQPVSQEVAFQGVRSPLFVQWDYHIVHCTFMWRQMHRAYERGFIDSHLGNYNHTLHCQKMTLMDSAAAAKAVTVAQVIYPECRRVTH